MYTYGDGVEVKIETFFTWRIDVNEMSASCFSRLAPDGWEGLKPSVTRSPDKLSLRYTGLQLRMCHEHEAGYYRHL
jgi:hypothetical protein